MRYELRTKAVQVAPTGAPMATNPAMRRVGNVEMDPGRPWAGDLYETGEVTDPDQAFAHFKASDGTDVEGWLDMGSDGTLIGWVRQGDEVYRYSDPHAWEADVDGAALARVDAGAVAAPGAVAPDAGGAPGEDQADVAADPAADPAATPDPQAEADAALNADDAAQNMPSIGEDGPDAFAAEDDDAAEEVDPTDALEDPTKLPEAEGAGGEEADETFADLMGDGKMPEAEQDEPVDPTAPIETEPADQPADEPAAVPAEPVEKPTGPLAPVPVPQTEPETEPEPTDRAQAEEVVTIDPADLPRVDDDQPAAEPTPADPADPAEDEPEGDDEDDEDDEDEEGKKKNPFEKKHLPGQHNQETHGNRHHHHVGLHKPRGGSSSSHDDAPSGGGSSDPKAPEPRKASLTREALRGMSDEDLDAITEDAELYDWDSMMEAAAELDGRNPIGTQVRDALAKTEPGSVEERQIINSVIPDAWAAWAGQGAKGKRPGGMTRKEQIDSEWMDYMHNMYLRAGEAVRGVFVNRRHQAAFSKRFGNEYALFDGTIRGAARRKWASEELIDWLDHNGMTYDQWLAEFYPSVARRRRNVGSTALGENG